ncbi:AlbA family DNA-binding domain-containing protein [Larkinella punicea]|uniref:ATP-binding protein n=1 Tax=Larkinella punicea TaxID=2315727 RepID=A0A368JI99_9BACT|nr:ATP-binding protein [Larkinella punicea]RCR67015.1 ATP-binding protein [Larkinella punicea]
MDITQEVSQIIEEREEQKIEYRAVLPPSRNLAQLISGFANTEGGYILLGIYQHSSGRIEVIGLSNDFHANSITHKALDLLTPQISILYQYVSLNDKKIYAIKVEKSETLISVEGKIYKRDGISNYIFNPSETTFNLNGYKRIKEINSRIEIQKLNATSSKIKLLEHYQSILKIIDDLKTILYPEDVTIPTTNIEGRILSKILYSSFVDNFETYLSDILYEIYLANPLTLKSKELVTIEEVLNCIDLQEFVKYYAKQKLLKLQKGSVKGFIKENNQIKDLNVFTEPIQQEVEKLLQIRHLYSHRNGIIDEKFLQYFTENLSLNTEYLMSVSEICDKLEYLFELVHKLDISVVIKYKLL